MLPIEWLDAPVLAKLSVLFDDGATYDELAARLEAGASVAVRGPALAEDGNDVPGRLGAGGTPMSIYTPDKELHVLAAGEPSTLEPSQGLIGLTS